MDVEPPRRASAARRRRRGVVPLVDAGAPRARAGRAEERTVAVMFSSTTPSCVLPWVERMHPISRFPGNLCFFWIEEPDKD